jgi:hypothetical protein
MSKSCRMIASRINVFLVALALSLAVAWADDVPAPDPQTTASPDDGVADAPDAPNSTGPVTASGPVAVGDINVVDGEPVGTLDDGSAGFGRTMWVNAQRGELEQLLAALPIASNDPVVRDLAIRLALTRSESPVGSGKRALVTIRLEKLLQVGMVSEAGEIAAVARIPNDVDFSRVQATALLLAGRTAEACGDATVARLTESEPFWLELRAYCFGAAGDDAQMDLIDQLLEAQGQDDAEYRMLRDDVLKHLNYMPGVIIVPKPIHVFLLKAAGLPVPPEISARFHLDAQHDPLELASVDYPISPDAVIQATEAFSSRGPIDPVAQRHGALTVGLADALGMPLSAQAQAVLPSVQTTQWRGSRPTQLDFERIGEAAVTEGRHGEAILRLIETLDARDLGDLAPDAAVQFVRQLRQLGLDNEARLLAQQALREYRDPPPLPRDVQQP